MLGIGESSPIPRLKHLVVAARFAASRKVGVIHRCQRRRRAYRIFADRLSQLQEVDAAFRRRIAAETPFPRSKSVLAIRCSTRSKKRRTRSENDVGEPPVAEFIEPRSSSSLPSQVNKAADQSKSSASNLRTLQFNCARRNDRQSVEQRSLGQPINTASRIKSINVRKPRNRPFPLAFGMAPCSLTSGLRDF